HRSHTIGVKICPKRNGHGEPPLFATLNHPFKPIRESQPESRSQGFGIRAILVKRRRASAGLPEVGDGEGGNVTMDLVSGQIVHDDDVAWPQLYPSTKAAEFCASARVELLIGTSADRHVSQRAAAGSVETAAPLVFLALSRKGMDRYIQLCSR